MKELAKRQIKCAGLAALMFFISATIFRWGVYPRINFLNPKTQSVKYKIFWSQRFEGEVKKDQYVRIKTDKIKSNLCDGPCIVFKRVGCLSGSLLYNKGREYFCDHEKVSQGLMDEELFQFNGTIPKGKFFLIGDHKFSYDSKVVGFFDEEEIDMVLIPLF